MVSPLIQRIYHKMLGNQDNLPKAHVSLEMEAINFIKKYRNIEHEGRNIEYEYRINE